jgi:hypothetical protein
MVVSPWKCNNFNKFDYKSLNWLPMLSAIKPEARMSESLEDARAINGVGLRQVCDYKKDMLKPDPFCGLKVMFLTPKWAV